MKQLDLELGTMDYVSYQMLDDPNYITDSRTEESFREDLDDTWFGIILEIDDNNPIN